MVLPALVDPDLGRTGENLQYLRAQTFPLTSVFDTIFSNVNEMLRISLLFGGGGFVNLMIGQNSFPSRTLAPLRFSWVTSLILPYLIQSGQILSVYYQNDYCWI